MKKIKIATGLVFSLGLLILPPISASAGPSPTSFPVNVTSALLNRTGGITASGTMSCADAVTAYDWTKFGASQGVPPAGLAVLVNVSWTAYQPIGRKTMLSASYGSSIKNPCFSNTDVYANQVCDSAAQPCPWITSNFGSSDVPVYVYADNGKFGPGRTHFNVYVSDPDGWVVIDQKIQCEINGEPPIDCATNSEATPVTLNLFSLTSSDVKATFAR